MPAGAKPGERRGGRTKGTKNKKTLTKLAALTRDIAKNETPLDFLLRVMRNGRLGLPVRMDAAKAALPFVHPKLAHVQLNSDQRQQIEIVGGLPNVRAKEIEIDKDDFLEIDRIDAIP